MFPRYDGPLRDSDIRLTLRQVNFSNSTNRSCQLQHRDKWSHECPYYNTLPVIVWIASSNVILCDLFKKSDHYCCGLDFALGEHAAFPSWMVDQCAENDMTHSLRVLQFIIELRGIPKPRRT